MRIMFLNHTPETERNRATKPEVERLLNTYASPGTTVELCYPDDFPGSRVFTSQGARNALNGLHLVLETPALVRKVVWAEANGFDAVVQSNTFDPGVQAARLAVRIPVVGLLRASLHTATTLGDRVGITVPLDAHIPQIRRILRTYGMEGFVAGIRALGMYSEGFAGRRDEILERAVLAVRSLVEEAGAESIIPVGGALVPQAISPADLERAVGVPVMNLRAIGVRFAETCVALGMSHSVRTYPVAQLDPRDYGARLE